MGFDTEHCVFQEIRQRILSGQLRSGTAININNLSEEMIVSPTPVRDALIRLAERDILESHRGKGFFVKATSSREMVDALKLLFCTIRISTENCYIDNTRLILLRQ